MSWASMKSCFCTATIAALGLIVRLCMTVFWTVAAALCGIILLFALFLLSPWDPGLFSSSGRFGDRRH